VLNPDARRRSAARVLEIGRRLVRRDPQLLVEPADLVHASREEILSLLAGAGGPSAAELGARSAHRRAYTVADAPALLGATPGAPPAADLLPDGARRLTEAVMGVLSLVLTPPPPPAAKGVGLKGCAASGGQWEGPALIVSSPDDARAIPPGAVLVVGAGSSSFTMLAPLASAVVAEGGGLLSHVAIVCREDRIPCVCGCPGVLSSIAHGQRVRVDGSRGTVEVVPDRVEGAVA
jgi:pyruvate,water dikinase